MSIRYIIYPVTVNNYYVNEVWIQNHDETLFTPPLSITPLAYSMKPPPCFNAPLYRIHHKISPLHLSPYTPLRRDKKAWKTVDSSPPRPLRTFTRNSYTIFTLSVSLSHSVSPLSSLILPQNKNCSCLCTPHEIALCAPFNPYRTQPRPSQLRFSILCLTSHGPTYNYCNFDCVRQYL